MFRRLHRRNAAALLPVVVACIAGTSAYAFTASNTMPTTAEAKAGAGSVAVGGYAVSNLIWSMTSGGTETTGVSFDLDSAASDVKVALISGSTPVSGDWHDCGASGSSSPYLVTCSWSTTPIAWSSADTLFVAAAGSGTIQIP